LQARFDLQHSSSASWRSSAHHTNTAMWSLTTVTPSYSSGRRPPVGITWARSVRLSGWELGLIIILVVGGAKRSRRARRPPMRAHSERHREPIGVLQGALLGLVG
jgi:hypothetical protein